MDSIRPVIWEKNTLKLLDQRILPQRYQYLSLQTLRSAADAIRDMVVRGAPAIGVTAAYAVVLGVQQLIKQNADNWKQALKPELDYLASSRPTAVNLFWAIEQMQRVIDDIGHQDPLPPLLSRADAILEADIADNKSMGGFGAELIRRDLIDNERCSVLTHCNAGALATGGYGTALGVIRSAWEQQLIAHVYADETRPWMQGARLTAWEMVQEQIPVSILVDGAASHIIQQSLTTDKPVKWVIVGSDRIAGNGDVANKIGTFGLAIVARYHGIKLMVAAPTSTIDMSLSSGQEIPIEQRNSREVSYYGGQRIAADQADAVNPAFDVTPAELVDAIVTEKGVVLNPDAAKMKKLMS